jgi:ABC-type lipoprotein export system ATPase subunit
MPFSLLDTLPIPLQEQSIKGVSDIWKTNCLLEKGKNYLVTAPSGKGKSTFLHMLYGVRKDYIGQVKLDNQDINSFSLDDWSDLRKNQLSIVFQDLRLFPKLSALDNILIKATLTRIKEKTDIEAMAQRLGIANLLQQTCETLSYGQRQRVAIIRALCQPFDFLFLDEPFSHLDEANTRAAFQLIQEVCKEQKAGFVLVSLGEEYGGVYDAKLLL